MLFKIFWQQNFHFESGIMRQIFGEERGDIAGLKEYVQSGVS
jgi:hypothetical protein